MTLQDLYRQTKNRFAQAGLDSPAFDALCLFESVFGFDRQALILHGGQKVPQEKLPAFLELAGQREARCPLQYLLGEWPFLSLTLKVGKGVLVPREDTQVLVEAAARHLPENPAVLDLCAGTGAVGLGVASLVPGANVTCVEWFADAERYLKENIRRYPGLQVQAVRADVLDPVSPARFSPVDAVVSNPPYILADEIQTLAPEVRREPRTALDGGADGFLFYRALARLWAPLVKPGGFIAVEVGEGQAAGVRELFAQAGFARCRTFQDLSGIERAVLAYRLL